MMPTSLSKILPCVRFFFGLPRFSPSTPCELAQGVAGAPIQRFSHD